MEKTSQEKAPLAPEVRQGWQELIQPKRMLPFEDDNYSGKYPQLFPNVQLLENK